MTLFDFSNKLKEFNQKKEFSKTLLCFNENKNDFHPNQISANKYLVYEMISAMIESNNYDSIFIFIAQYDVKLDPKNFSYLLKKFKDKPSVNWNVVNQFCDLVEVDLLDTTCKTIEIMRRGQPKSMELASDKENWFAFKTKGLFEIKQFDDCFALSKIALETFDKFHYSNEIWFARRIALSKIHLGKTDEALSELLLILKKKKEWFIESEVATIYKDKLEYDKALEYAIAGLNNFGDIEYKVGLIQLSGELLLHKKENNLAFKHFSLSKLLRLKMEWNIPNSLLDQLAQFEEKEIKINELDSLKSELSIYWKSISVLPIKKLEVAIIIKGEVKVILHNNEKGMDGFISYEKTKSIYFNLFNDNPLLTDIKVGTKLSFKIIPDKLKLKDKAVILELI
jgi:hypothetical protein